MIIIPKEIQDREVKESADARRLDVCNLARNMILNSWATTERVASLEEVEIAFQVSEAYKTEEERLYPRQKTGGQ